MTCQKTCERCGVVFSARPWNAGRFCSRRCMRDQTIEARFWSKVAVRHEPVACWLFTGRDPLRHKTFAIANGVYTQAHRYSYELAAGPIPGGLFVCHRCDVPACVRPTHLFLGTQGDNIRDMVSKGRHRRGPNHGVSPLRG